MAAIDDLRTLAQQIAKADGDDSDVLNSMLDSAIKVCSNYCRRNLYLDQASLDTDMATFSDKINAAATAWDAANTAYNASSCTTLDELTYDAAARDFTKATNAAFRIKDGIIVDDAIRGAIMQTAMFFYKNRQESDKPPVIARMILEPYMAV